jgi:hypothetical protein
MNLNNYKLSKEDFNNLPIIDKRKYLLQTDIEETNWWLRTVAKITVVSLILAVFSFFILVSFKM